MGFLFVKEPQGVGKEEKPHEANTTLGLGPRLVSCPPSAGGTGVRGASGCGLPSSPCRQQKAVCVSSSLGLR